MNDKLQYATMLEIPVSTCNITEIPKTNKRGRKKKKVNPETVKQELIEKVNSVQDGAEKIEKPEERQIIDQAQIEQEYSEQLRAEETQSPELLEQPEQEVMAEEHQESATVRSIKEREKTEKPKFKFSIIGVQLAVIAVLAATIFLTNAFYADSGINVFFRNVFGNGEVVSTDARTYDKFSPVIAMGNNQGVVLTDGVISFGGEGSVYAPCDGVVSSLTRDENGKFVMEITHSENFKSLITGVDYVYAGLNDKVYRTIPVGYLDADGATMCFTRADGSVINNYKIIDNMVVWAV